MYIIPVILHFNPRARKERDRKSMARYGKIADFNPRARKERDETLDKH